MPMIETSRGMPAVKEIVFAEAARLSKRGQWLPAVGLALIEDVTPHELTEVDRFRWPITESGRAESADSAGWLEVVDVGAGGSEVTLGLQVSGDADATDALRARVEESLAELHSAVLQRVTDAS